VSEAERPASARWRRDLLWAVGVALASYTLAAVFDFHERFASWAARHESWDADELAFGLAVLAGGLAWVAWRRRAETEEALRRRIQAEVHAGELLAHNRELAQGLIALQENERRALARELHDEFGQAATAIRVETAWLRRAALGDREGMLAAARRADNAAHDLYQLVRDLLRRLRPADLDALGLVGDDETARLLTPLILTWPGKNGFAKAITGLHVLGRIGSPIALAQLDEVARNTSFPALASAAASLTSAERVPAKPRGAP